MRAELRPGRFCGDDMIIEGAFYKLPELLLCGLSSKERYESTFIGQFAMGILLELSARNVEQPVHRIHIEKPYPELRNGKSPGRADLFIDLSNIYVGSIPEWYAQYGMKPSNRMEAKVFGRIRERAGSETKTSNAGSIALDLFRLCLLVQEIPTGFRDNARYFLTTFDKEPSNYLALGRRSSEHPSRDWLRDLLSPGESEISPSLKVEPPSFRRLFFGDAIGDKHDLEMKLRVVTKEFSPTEHVSEFLYWGYLVRIVDFLISSLGRTFQYQDASTEV